jgi:uracil-DNA glycosylase
MNIKLKNPYYQLFKDKHLVLQTVHPSPLSAHRGFFECQHWSQANAYLKSHFKQEIEWNCLMESD